jgi:type III secretion protein T
MIDPLAIATLLRESRPLIIALGLGAARFYGLLMVLPMFTRLGLTGVLRGGVAVAFALPLVPFLAPLVASAPAASYTALGLLLAKEAAVGFAIGTLFGLPFWVAEAVGDIIDQQRGSQAALVPDASSTEQSGITGTLLSITLITLFLMSGGWRYLLDGVFASYTMWPPLAAVPHFSPDAGDRIISLLDALLRGGALLAAPLLIAMLLAELTLGLISRFMPQLNVFDIALSVKGLIVTVGLPVYAVFLIAWLRDGLAPLASLPEQLQRLAQ